MPDENRASIVKQAMTMVLVSHAVPNLCLGGYACGLHAAGQTGFQQVCVCVWEGGGTLEAPDYIIVHLFASMSWRSSGCLQACVRCFN